MVADGYKETEIGIIPVEWDVAKLETICDVRDGTHDSPKYQENGIPFITSKHLTDNGVDFSDVNYISNEDHINFSKRSLVENGDILFGMIGTIGKPLIVNYDFEFSIKNVALLKFKDNTQLNNSFTLNLLKSKIIDKQFSKLSNGGVQSFIALGMIRSLQIPLPPLKEQEKIADILSITDDKIDAITSQIEKAQTLKKGLLQKLLSEGIGHSEFKDSELGKIPESWDIVELRDIGKVSMCKRIMKSETTEYGEIPFYKIGTFGKEADAYISRELYTDYKNKYSFPKKGDILISASGTIGRTVIYDGALAYFQDSNIVWIANQEDKALNSFLFYVYITVKWHTDGNTIARLYNENLRRIKIPLPPLEEQKQIAEILSTTDEKLEVLRAKKEKFETLKKGLLQKLLSGEVRV